MFPQVLSGFYDRLLQKHKSRKYALLPLNKGSRWISQPHESPAQPSSWVCELKEMKRIRLNYWELSPYLDVYESMSIPWVTRWE